MHLDSPNTKEGTHPHTNIKENLFWYNRNDLFRRTSKRHQPAALPQLYVSSCILSDNVFSFYLDPSQFSSFPFLLFFTISRFRAHAPHYQHLSFPTTLPLLYVPVYENQYFYMMLYVAICLPTFVYVCLY